MSEEQLPELPPLPEPKELYLPTHVQSYYDPSDVADLMREYARSAVRMESYVIDMLVAAGHVTQAKVDEARRLAAAIREGGR